MKNCPVTNCDKRIPHGKAYCLHHWRQVSLVNRAEIYQSYEKFIAGRIGVKDHYSLLLKVTLKLNQTEIEKCLSRKTASAAPARSAEEKEPSKPRYWYQDQD